ncbi:ankyrin repeat domain-containing protein [Bosea sp. (in: a-proteobacteria)]|jgi:ankyrin repeat protein|uniref:ankyrin repeat domain-containing protein n=1 Tax=Bosea sp. (in: a-proteobacteria) TaxID=1871050 RepID=UPI002DDD80F9|nr:ankyrin repeat domain-containing protein [Bosea sp. (in: a-proteobacteria)]HEV2511418.1 ankyrin repeat domain-containing protein [Bosea sp. (in: a-proteobacteria)]
MSDPTRELTPRSNLETVRRQAKRWLKEIEAGDTEALARFRKLIPNHAGAPKLREVQHALARDYGLANWAALKQELAAREVAARGHAALVALFLEKSALRYGVRPGTQSWGEYEADRPARGALAQRLLERHPEIISDSIHTAVAAHDLDTVRGFLSKDAALADKPSGFDGWTPLVRLAFTRLPSEELSRNAVTIAQLLLDHGADPNALFSDGTNHFTPLTGVIGGGENSQPPHPQAQALARLLIAHGADPLNGQALYNSSLGADDVTWLDLLWNETEKRGETQRWHEPVRELPAPPLDYLLGNAVPRQPRRAAWLLAHGANAQALNAYSKQSLVRQAMLDGRSDLVRLLVDNGASPVELDGQEAFTAAVARGDETEAHSLLAGNPEFRLNPAPLFVAIRQGKPEIAALALHLGVSPDAQTRDGVRALHEAAGNDAIEIVALLVKAGAEIDPIERPYGSTPLGWARHQGASAVQVYLASRSRDIQALCEAAEIERLETLFAEEPTLANAPARAGEPPLFCLPDDDTSACDLVEFLLGAGADPAVRNAEGLTPAHIARKRGLLDAAALLEAHILPSGEKVAARSADG